MLPSGSRTLKSRRPEGGFLLYKSGAAYHRAYERKAKDINKAQMDIVMALADALKCEIGDLIG